MEELDTVIIQSINDEQHYNAFIDGFNAVMFAFECRICDLRYISDAHWQSANPGKRYDHDGQFEYSHFSWFAKAILAGRAHTAIYIG